MFVLFAGCLKSVTTVVAVLLVVYAWREHSARSIRDMLVGYACIAE